MTKFYAGIGSRQTPPHILNMMADIALELKEHGYILRSGGANGADTAFTRKLERKDTQIFLPWAGFNDCSSDFVGATPRAMEIAEQIHPAWHKCSQGAKKLHGRNVHQILGEEMDPKTYSSFVICWTPMAQDVGGTATAIKLARQCGIRVINLASPSDKELMEKFLKGLK